MKTRRPLIRLSRLSIVTAIAPIFVIVSCAQGPSSEHRSGQESTVAMPANHLQGGQDAGGGKGVRCRSRAQTLDLYEAQTIKHQTIDYRASNLDEALVATAYKLGIHLDNDVPPTATDAYKVAFAKIIKDDMYGHFQYIPTGQRLAATNDATLPALGNECELIQIASYQPDGRLLVDQEYWSSLKPEDQAALLIHEWLYRRARESHGLLNSDETRKVVAMFFSAADPQPVLSPTYGKPRLNCAGGGGEAPFNGETYEFYVIDDIVGKISGIRFYFRHAKNHMLMSRTTAFAPGLSIQKIARGEFNQLLLNVNNDVLPSPWTFELEKFSTDDSGNVTFKMVGRAHSEKRPVDSLGSCELENN